MGKNFETLTLPLIFEEEEEKKPKKKVSLTENAKRVLRARYLRKNLEGEIIETFEEMFERVASTIALAELRYSNREAMLKYKEKFYDMMVELLFLPNSPTLMNAGTEEGQLSACFVIPVGDSMVDIFEAVKYAALIQKSGGGVGYSFSKLRPAGDRVRTTRGVSSGPISFMRVFNEATETVKQGGKRRGANMGVLRVDHPDILEFINAKVKEGEFSNFNISVGITDVFMEAVKEGKPYDLINPRSGKKVKSLDARFVWKNIVQNAWNKGEPGVLFLDTINKYNPTPSLGTIESTNPCGEACLLPYEACNLGSINLSKFVKNGAIDFDRLKKVVHLAVRFLDDVIDVNEYVPLIPQIRRQTKGNRKIGLGVMGFADMLIDLGISYKDERAIKIADMVMEFIQKEAKEASKALARERGCFPNWEKSVYFPDTPIRNACVTSIAPTGSLSIIAGCSPGIEPLFGVCFERNILDDERFLEVNPRFEKIAKKEGFYSEELMRKIAQRGTVQDFDEIPQRVKDLFVTAYDIPPEIHVLMQAAFQRHVDMSVSKTINMPQNSTVEDVEKVYWLAYTTGCKGLTVYRYGSRQKQVISLGDSSKKKEKTKNSFSEEIAQLIKDLTIDPKQMEMKETIPVSSVSKEDNTPSLISNEIPCPECGHGTIVLGACSVCQHCGYSRCG